MTADRGGLSLRTAEGAWRELLRTSASLLREFEERGDFGGSRRGNMTCCAPSRR